MSLLARQVRPKINMNTRRDLGNLSRKSRCPPPIAVSLPARFNYILGDFILFVEITLPADVKNSDLQKKRKKKILSDTTGKMLVFSVIKDHYKNGFKTLLDF